MTRLRVDLVQCLPIEQQFSGTQREQVIAKTTVSPSIAVSKSSALRLESVRSTVFGVRVRTG